MPQPEEFQTNETANAVPAQGETTQPEAVETDALEEQEPEPRTFTQEEMNATIGERLAKERRKWEREQARKAEQSHQPSDEAPKLEQFKTAQEYIDALTDWKVEQKIAQQTVRQQEMQVATTFQERVAKARETHSDIDVIFKSPDEGGPWIDKAASEAIKESDIGPQIAYYLAKHPEEAIRIFDLSPIAQAKEIGKIEVKLSQNPPTVKKTSSAPEPIKPVGTRSSSSKFSPSDPRSVSQMSPSEWIEARNREIAKNGR